MAIKEGQVHELLYQALETEAGGIEIYTEALKAAKHPELNEEWSKYLEETKHHHEVLLQTFEALSLDPKQETPGRKVVRHQGESLVEAMRMARQEGDPAAAQLVATECVVLAETKDHQNWSLLADIAEEATGELKKAIKAAVDEVEDEEDEHLYHTKGWSRELWLDSMGVKAVLPPPEEEKSVKTAIGAARAAQARKEMT